MIDPNNTVKLIGSVKNKLTELGALIDLIGNAMDRAEPVEMVDEYGQRIFRCGRCGAVIEYTDNFCSVCGTGVAKP